MPAAAITAALIVPGPALMVDSLLRGTRGIQRRAGTAATRVARPPLYARHTRAALEGGSRHSVAALIDRASDEARRLTGRRPRLLLTGGAAAQVAPLLRHAHSVIPDLVLRGVAALATKLP